MTEITPQETLASLQAARAGIVAALDMHVTRAEELAAEVARIDEEIAQVKALGGT